MNLREHSLNVIRQNQAENGAFIASPNFPVYLYSWFRDGSYIAHALDLAGDHQNAGRFFAWAIWAVGQRVDAAERAIAAGLAGAAPDPADLLDTRYTVDGKPGEMEWFNNQLDGFGTLLWSIGEHVHARGELESTWIPAIELLARYVGALWRQPCSDCWEEFPDKIHVASLSAIYGGLHVAARLLAEPRFALEAEQIRAFVLEHGVVDGRLAKFVGSDLVDASLIHASWPYRMLEPGHPIMRATVERIERDILVPGGGLHRYIHDNYFGGGEWVLLTAYLGCHYVDRGEPQRAEPIRAWIEAQADARGDLPEQVTGHLLLPDMYQTWVEKWGPPAVPLVWSHAAYLTLLAAMGDLPPSEHIDHMSRPGAGAHQG